MGITHQKVSAIPDGPDTDLVRPSDWNAAHAYDDLDGTKITGPVPLFSLAGKTYYIDAAAGNDANDGETPATAWQTWARAESVIPINLAHAWTIYIIGHLSQSIILRGRTTVGDGNLLVRGETVTPSNHEVTEIQLEALFGSWNFRYLRLTGDRLDVRSCLLPMGGTLRYLQLHSPTVRGAAYFGSIANLWDCDFGTDNCEDCIYAHAAVVSSANNTGRGTRHGLSAAYAATIGKHGNQPEGLVGNEHTLAGGEIR